VLADQRHEDQGVFPALHILDEFIQHGKDIVAGNLPFFGLRQRLKNFHRPCIGLIPFFKRRLNQSKMEFIIILFVGM